MTQALEQRLGGSPFGPAGTGKTESVKALGQNLGKFVLVFCCDESFDFQAIGRILAGICQVGAWGCFDEFNRLNEQILSAVSMQIEAIELGIKAAVRSDTKSEIELANRTVALNDETGIFITMNPEYAGRNTLPENLKKLFRSFSMAKPDKEVIAEVLLNSQGFVHARKRFVRLLFHSSLSSRISFPTRSITILVCVHSRTFWLPLVTLKDHVLVPRRKIRSQPLGNFYSLAVLA